jgi:hypothetical protein
MGNTRENWCTCAWTLNHSLTERTGRRPIPPSFSFLRVCLPRRLANVLPAGFTIGNIARYYNRQLAADDLEQLERGFASQCIKLKIEPTGFWESCFFVESVTGRFITEL